MKRSALVLPILPTGEVLLQKRDNKLGIANPGQIGIFGGTIEGDEDPRFAAVREAREELELEILPDELKLLFEAELPEREGGILVHYYIFTALCKDFSKLVLHEGEAIVRVQPKDIFNLPNLVSQAYVLLKNLVE